MSSEVQIQEALILDADGNRIKAKNGKEFPDFMPLITEINIKETIDFPCIRMSIVVNDSIQLIDNLRGNEIVRISLASKSTDKKTFSYTGRIYRIGSRIRMEKKETYVLECVSREFMINETKNVFGSFKNKVASKIVRTIMKDIIETDKKLLIEDTMDNIQCVIPSWRPFEVINWLGNKSVRSSNKEQGGFIFYENRRGFNFSSFDKMIEDATGQSDVPTYKYKMKNTGEGTDAEDLYTIESISYPNTFDSLQSLRNGTFAGVFVGVSLDFLNESKVKTPQGSEVQKDIPYGGSEFTIHGQWGKMSHMASTNPYRATDEQLKDIYQSIRRIRYRPNQVHLWDQDKAGANIQSRWEQTAIYNYCRKNSFSAIKLDIKIPGNLILTAGDPIDVEIPRSMSASGRSDKIEIDRTYSGRYIVAGIRHKYGQANTLQTELTIVKDSLGSVKPKP